MVQKCEERVCPIHILSVKEPPSLGNTHSVDEKKQTLTTIANELKVV